MRLPIILVLLAMLLVVPCSAQNLVKIKNVTADVDWYKRYSGISEGQTLRITLHLPFPLKNFSIDPAYIAIVIGANASTTSTTVNVTVNGVPVAVYWEIPGGGEVIINESNLVEAGVDMNATVLDIVIEAVYNNTDYEDIYLYLEDNPVLANFSYTVKEVIVSKPKVTFYEEDSFYTVKQIVNITQNSDIDLLNVMVNFTYPENALNEPITSYNFGTLNSSEYKTLEIAFQKRGPYVGEVKYAVSSDGNYITTIKIYSPENLTAEMIIDPEKRPWSKYFPEFGKIIEVKLNGKKIEYETGSIDMNLNLNKGWNELKIEYEPLTQEEETHEIEYVPVVFEEEKPWWEQEIFGAPAWLWVIAVFILVIGVVVRIRR